ncbi:hypothetical protein BCR34DRAFT_571841 [Clohesyomyces aquaticus]|uniref:DUF924-domain-containing protein n=1 Tax=Clohesyomyces aquaticus TaxID=1231657 RepID=A0A1Y1Z661_9PLEO|nr:hypothetical protein BCR34DRAFT_571841 [Clohesyomyces aquaticus]
MLAPRTANLRVFSILSLLPTVQRRPMSSFTLNKSIFNPALYHRVRDVWFEGHSLDTKMPKPEVMQRWWMAPPEEKLRFDSHCRDNFGAALSAIGPENWPSPNVSPFVQEIQDAARANSDDNGVEAAWTALSIILLLDQMSRNIYRTSDGLVKIYTHYDKIAQALIGTILSEDSPIGRLDLNPMWLLKPMHRSWFYMPLLHSEDIDQHKQVNAIIEELSAELDEGGADEESMAKGYWQKFAAAEKDHVDIIEKFGRYPHRNDCLGRESTEEEKTFLKDGGKTFGVAQK